MLKLVEDGFTESSISELKDICATNFNDNPVVYYTLSKIVEDIEDAFGNQGMYLKQYQKYCELISLIVNVLETKNIESLNELIRTFQYLRQ